MDLAKWKSLATLRTVSVERWIGQKQGVGVGRGMEGEELVVACVDNFWAQLDPERGPEEWSGSWKDMGVEGRGFLRSWWYICALMRNSGEEMVGQEQWVGSPEQKPSRPVGEDPAFLGGGTLPPCGQSASAGAGR